MTHLEEFTGRPSEARAKYLDWMMEHHEHIKVVDRFAITTAVGNRSAVREICILIFYEMRQSGPPQDIFPRS